MRAAILTIVLFTTAAGVASAQPGPFGTGQDLRLEGIVEPPAGAATLGDIRIRGGGVVRRFGVIHAQTSRTEGMSLFRRSSLNPFQLLLRANSQMTATFTEAAPGTRLRMLGRYVGDDFILAEITVVPPPTAAAP
ncbi:MAG: hypothetical protein ACRERC_10330 [Candidatus Binatia bacterium]